jgi:flagellar basal-body rod protein FlgC
MNVIASNLANMETTRTEGGGPYRRKMVVMSTKPVDTFDNVLGVEIQGSQIDSIVDDRSPFRKVYSPGHPDADKDGYLLKPNVDLIVEVTNMVMSRRVFEANIAVLKSTRQMAIKALEIGR